MAADTSTQRDEYIDLCRAFSLVVVVLWHWVFTIVVWTPSGPRPSNPIGFTKGLWALTWLLQVLPLFFFVGGFAHMQLWARVSASGGGYRRFVGGRMKRLAVPSLALLGTWGAIYAVLVAFGAPPVWLARAVVLVVSPLWFIGVYLVLVVFAPLMLTLHRRFGVLVPVLLVGAAWFVDTLRFDRGVDWVAYLNLFVVWALCHQLGFFYRRLVDAPRVVGASMALGGGIALVNLVTSGLYPGSMVGVPGAPFSNMGPPTLCIVALCFFQAGISVLIRPWVLERAQRPRWERANDVVNRFALPLFLFHMTGYAMALGLLMALGYRPPQEPTVAWWLQRPLFLVFPLLCTLPVILLFGRRWVTPRLEAAEAKVPTGPVPGSAGAPAGEGSPVAKRGTRGQPSRW